MKAGVLMKRCCNNRCNNGCNNRGFLSGRLAPVGVIALGVFVFLMVLFPFKFILLAIALGLICLGIAWLRC